MLLQRIRAVVRLGERSEVAQRIAALRLLDLDDFGALLAEEARAKRCGDSSAEIENPKALERAAAHVCSVCSAKTSFIEPFAFRASKASSAVAVLCIQWCAWKW